MALTDSKPAILIGGQNWRVLGGSDRYMVELYQLLADRGHRVIPFAVSHPANLPSKWSGFFPRDLDFRNPSLVDVARFIYSGEARRQLARMLDLSSVNIAHLNIFYGKLTGSILSEFRRREVPVVQTLHEYRLVCPVSTLERGGALCNGCSLGNYWRAAVHRCNRRSYLRSLISAVESQVNAALAGVGGVQRYIAVSEFQRRTLIARGVEEQRIVTIHNFTKIPELAVSMSSAAYFLYAGRVERIKGIMTLLAASSMVRDVPLLIAGDGEGMAEAHAFVESHRLSHVSFLGWVSPERAGELMAGALCTILPSEWPETFGLTLVETLARGRPVIGSRIGGIPEVIDEGEDGFLFEPGDGGQLSELLVWFRDHPGEALEMGLRGRRRVERLFSPETYYEKLRYVYDDVLF